MKNNYSPSTASGIYGLGLIGSLIYFLPHATTFWSVILGILQSFAWPAVLVYNLLNFFRL